VKDIAASERRRIFLHRRQTSSARIKEGQLFVIVSIPVSLAGKKSSTESFLLIGQEGLLQPSCASLMITASVPLTGFEI